MNGNRRAANHLTAPVVMIGLGVLFLIHMAMPGFNGTAMVGCFLLLLGFLKLAQHLLPQVTGMAAPGGSLLGPIVLIALGTLFLLHEYIPSAQLGAWFAHYWPVLLIVWGLARLVEFYRGPGHHPQAMDGGEVVLLIFIILFGLSFSGVYHYRDSRMAHYWGFNPGTWNPFYDSYTFTTSSAGSVPAGATVVVRGYRGNVEVHAGTGSAIAAQLSDSVKAENHDAAQHIFQNAQPRISVEGNEVVVEPIGGESLGDIDAGMQLTLPANAPLSVQIQNGDIAVADWHADLTLSSGRGAIKITNTTGNVDVNAGHDDVTLDHVGGSVHIRGTGGDIDLTNVGGLVTLEGEYTGSLNFRKLAEGMQFTSSRTSFRAATLAGTLEFDMGHLTLDGGTEVQVRTRDESIELHNVTGTLSVDDRNEPVTVTFAATPNGPATVTTQNADIHVELPPSSRFGLDASARRGSIDTDFGINVEDNEQQAEAHGQSGGGGPKITLATTNGSITVRKN